MDISGFGISGGGYGAGYVRKKERKDVAFVSPPEESRQEKVREQDILLEKEDGKEEKGGSQAQIVVKPDGSRVLMVTTRVCGMETTTSLKISDPADMLHVPKMGEPEMMEMSRLDLRESGAASE